MTLKIAGKINITLFFMVSFFQVSKPLRYALVDVTVIQIAIEMRRQKSSQL
jgi:hypothetical protein